jgi:NADH-quinone oxidoreductase subunit G
MFGNEIQRYREERCHEVEEFICNSCRFDHKDPQIGLLGPRKFDKDSSTKIIILEN